ncbi:MAG: extracellular solute-binding protein [Chloroflexi bacterium]|nr:extracellular solute-binding protein [Chloroflexota bacterium]
MPLTLYAATGYDDAMAKAFQTATGIPVNLVADSTGPLLAKIQAEKNNPQWSIVWIDGAEPIAALDQQGQLLKGYTPAVDWNPQGKSLIPQDQSYFPLGVTVVGSLFYNSSKVSTPPASWQDLLKPEWKGALGMNNPSISGPTYPFVAGLMDQLGGEDQGKTYFKQLKANGLQVFNKNKDTLHAMDIGQIKLSAVQSTAGLGIMGATPTLKVAYLPKVVLLPNVMAIDGKASPQVQAEAKQFAEFIFSAQGQQIAHSAAKDSDACCDSWFWPVINGQQPIAGMPDLNTIPTTTVDPYAWGAKEDEINQWFTDNIVP